MGGIFKIAYAPDIDSLMSHYHNAAEEVRINPERDDFAKAKYLFVCQLHIDHSDTMSKCDDENDWVEVEAFPPRRGSDDHIVSDDHYDVARARLRAEVRIANPLIVSAIIGSWGLTTYRERCTRDQGRNREVKRDLTSSLTDFTILFGGLSKLNEQAKSHVI